MPFNKTPKPVHLWVYLSSINSLGNCCKPFHLGFETFVKDPDANLDITENSSKYEEKAKTACWEKSLNSDGSLITLQFSSVAQLCLTLCDPMDCSMPGLPEFTQTHVHWVGGAIQPSHPLSSPSPPAFNLSQHQGLFQWVSSLHQVAKVLAFQLHHQSFQWTLRTDLL